MKKLLLFVTLTLFMNFIYSSEQKEKNDHEFNVAAWIENHRNELEPEMVKWLFEYYGPRISGSWEENFETYKSLFTEEDQYLKAEEEFGYKKILKTLPLSVICNQDECKKFFKALYNWNRKC